MTKGKKLIVGGIATLLIGTALFLCSCKQSLAAQEITASEVTGTEHGLLQLLAGDMSFYLDEIDAQTLDDLLGEAGYEFYASEQWMDHYIKGYYSEKSGLDVQFTDSTESEITGITLYPTEQGASAISETLYICGSLSGTQTYTEMQTRLESLGFQRTASRKSEEVYQSTTGNWTVEIIFWYENGELRQKPGTVTIKNSNYKG